MDLNDFEEFVLDRPEDEKWGLINGRVVRGMVGACLDHARIVQNVNFALRAHIRSKGLPGETFTESAWLKQSFQKLAAFPDVMVRCGDRGEKAAAYMRLATPQHVCFIDRDRVLIEAYDRRGDAWVPRAPIENVEETFELAALEFSMPVAKVYRDVLP